MTKAERESNREFVQRWKRVGPLLEEIKERELANMTHKDAMFAIRCVLELAAECQYAPRKTSGLVELQKLLAPLRS